MFPPSEQSDTARDANTTLPSIGLKGKTATVFEPGLIVDQSYRLIEQVGKGGMGVVFSCTHLVLQKDYALKLLLASKVSREAWSRFQIEAKALAKLNHPGIVGIHNMGVHKGSDDETPYYVMDLLSGENLSYLVRKTGPLQVDDALVYFMQVADALQSAHTQGVVHRDIKPSNLMLLRDQTNHVAHIKIVDFGIARVTQTASSGLSAQSQTATGVIIGTPVYMSPEQCRGERVDQRSDIYSFGCTLFEALTGEPPFRGANAMQTLMMHQSEAVPKLAGKMPESELTEQFSAGLQAVIDKALQKKVSLRYQSMAQLKHDLVRIMEGKEVSNKGLIRATVADIELFDTSAMEERELERQRHNERNFRNILEGGEDESDEDKLVENGSRKRQRLFIGISVAISLAVVGIVSVTLWQPVPKAEPNHELTDVFTDYPENKLTPPLLMKQIGTSASEQEVFKTFNWPAEVDYESNSRRLVEAYMTATTPPKAKLLKYKNGGAFRFPSEFYIGAIQFDDRPIEYATGFMPLAYPLAEESRHEVHYYSNAFTKKYVQLLDRFGPDDLTGIDCKFENVKAAIAKLSKWHRLKDLSFFNCLTKCLPNYEDQIEDSPMSDQILPSLNSFSNLRSLGLAGPKISGRAITQMPLLGKLKCLKVKGITDCASLLASLPRYDNIEELWLMTLGLEDSDLEPLTRMKNLKSLRITRSQLTPKSLEYFKRMPALEKLKLDRPWTNEETAKFKEAMPIFEFEPVFDFRFWKFSPEKAPSEGLLSKGAG
ncbi:hypothetical protein BH11CYA1_BH11CYA1_15600 [soil metagenome]